MTRARRPSPFLLYALVGQLVAIVSLPIISRVLEPNHFGSLQAWLAWIGLGAAVANWRLDLRVQQGKARWMADRAISQAVVLSIPVALIFGPIAAYALKSPNASAILVSSIAVWVSSLAPVCIASLLRESESQVAGQVSALTTGGSATLQTGGAWATGLGGSVTGTALGRLIAVSVAMLAIRPSLAGADMRITELLRTLKRQSPFLLASLLSQASLAAPLLFLPLALPADDFGRFSIAWRVGALPMALIGGALSQYWIATASEAIRLGEAAHLYRSFRRALLGLATASIVVVVPTMLGAGLLAAAIFGTEWSGASQYFYLVAPVAAAQVIAGPFGQTLLLTGRVREAGAIDGVRLGALALVVAFSRSLELAPEKVVLMLVAVIVCSYGIGLYRSNVAIRSFL